MKKCVLFFTVLTTFFVAVGATNIVARIQPVKDWRLEEECINFSLVIDNLGDESVYVTTNKHDVSTAQLYGQKSMFTKGSIQMSFDAMLADHECLFQLNPLKRAVTDIIYEDYCPLYETNGTRTLEYYMGGGKWIVTEPFTNNVSVVIPTQTNQLGQFQLYTASLNQRWDFMVSFYEVTIPNGERWVYYHCNIPV